MKGYTIAEGSRTSKGMNIVNLLQLAEGEKVTNMICQSKDAEQSGGYVTMVTKQGLIKRTPLEQYANIRKSGLIGIALNEGDALGLDPPDLRPRYAHRCHPQRSGHPLQRGGRPPDGS